MEDHSFTPSDGSLVDRYLRAKIDGKMSDLASAFLFHDADVCSARPQDLVRDYAPARVPSRDAGDGQQWYFFSPARFVGKSKTRRSRTIDGSGETESWHSEGSPKPVEGSAGGHVQKFSYHIRTAPGAIEKPGWIMAEYSFKNTSEVVLCKIYKSPRGPGRSRSSSSSSSTITSSTISGCKRKAADDGEHLDSATACSRPRQADEDDAVMFAESIEHDMLSVPDYDRIMAETKFGEATQHVDESQPEPQLAPATVEGIPAMQEIEAFVMAEVVDDGTTLQVPVGEDPLQFYMRFFDDNQEQATIDELFLDGQQQDDAIQTVHGPLTEGDVIAALANGTTVDDLFQDGPSTS